MLPIPGQEEGITTESAAKAALLWLLRARASVDAFIEYVSQEWPQDSWTLSQNSTF